MAQRQESSEPDPARPSLLEILGENIYRRRVLPVPKMSQEALADLSDVAVNTIAGIEAGRDPSKKPPPYPQLDTIEKIAGGLGCEPADLLRWNPTRAIPSAKSSRSPSPFKLVPGWGRKVSPVQPPIAVVIGR